MVKCLMKTYKSSVNANLPYFGELRIPIHNVSNITEVQQRRIELVTRDPDCKIFTVDGSAKLCTSEDLTNPSNSITYKDVIGSKDKLSIYCLDGDYDVVITNRYKITALEAWNNKEMVWTLDLAKLSYCADLEKLRFEPGFNGCFGNISSLGESTKLKFVRIGVTYTGKNVFGDIGVFSNMKSINTIVFQDISGITGKLSSLNNLILLSDLAINESSVTGAFEDLVKAQCNAGRTSGELKSWHTKANITLNGKKPNFKLLLKFTASGCDIYEGVDTSGKKVASYVKSTNTWSYNN